MNTIAIIQARMSSTRLPKKVLKKINGKPMLRYLLDRLLKSKYINKIIVATSTDKSDDILYKFCNTYHIEVFRGSLNNVLDRFYQTAIIYKADIVIRITADCPFIDPKLLDKGIASFLKKKPDYLSNIIKRTYPRGFDFEIMSFKTLKNAFLNAKNEFEREHVTPYIYKTNPEKFKLYNIRQKSDYSKYQLTVDTIEDFDLIEILITKFRAHLLDYKKIINIMIKNPKLSLINQKIRRKTI